MKIKSVSVRNFRTLENIDVKFPGNYCTISGANNAGKTSIISIIERFFQAEPEFRLSSYAQDRFSYAKDVTQWKNGEEITVEIVVLIEREADAELWFFVEKFAEKKLEGGQASIKLMRRINESENIASCSVEGDLLDERSSTEVLEKLKSTNNLFVHKSPNHRRHLYFNDGEFLEMMDIGLSEDDKKKLSEAEKQLQRKIQSVARQHKDELSKLLGRLSDEYSVDITTLDRKYQDLPIGVTLNDKRAEVPLSGWGSGTQNRTYILMSLLQASKTKMQPSDSIRTTPIVWRSRKASSTRLLKLNLESFWRDCQMSGAFRS